MAAIAAAVVHQNDVALVRFACVQHALHDRIGRAQAAAAAGLAPVVRIDARADDARSPSTAGSAAAATSLAVSGWWSMPYGGRNSSGLDAQGAFEQQLGQVQFQLQLRLRDVDVEFRMRERVIADLIALARIRASQVRRLGSPLRRSRKTSPGACFLLQDVENLRRHSRIGAVVETQRDFSGRAPICSMRQESG